MTKTVRGRGPAIVGIGCILVLAAASVAHTSREAVQDPRSVEQQQGDSNGQHAAGRGLREQRVHGPECGS